jgi:hypothetical protein
MKGERVDQGRRLTSAAKKRKAGNKNMEAA